MNTITQLPLSVGQSVRTYYGWYAVIMCIDEKLFKFGQGIEVIRLDDYACFSISPNDIDSTELKIK